MRLSVLVQARPQGKVWLLKVPGLWFLSQKLILALVSGALNWTHTLALGLCGGGWRRDLTLWGLMK